MFKPALKHAKIPQFQITAEELITKHFDIKFKRKDKEEANLTILEKKLTNLQDLSQLLIKFQDSLLKSNTEYIKLQIEDPLLFRTTRNQTPEKAFYLKNETFRILVVEEERENHQKAMLLTAQIARGILITVMVISLISRILVGAGTSTLYMIKLFNIIDIISNFANINVEFGPAIVFVIEFIERLRIPEIAFLVKLSPIKDSSYNDPDVNAYLTMPRGTRGKMTTASNREVLIGSGQNFIIICLIFGFLAISKVLGPCFSQQKSRLLRFMTFGYYYLFGLMFFDYQMISITEVAFFDFGSLGKYPAKIWLSFCFSFSILILIIYEYLAGYLLIRGSKMKGKLGGDGREEVSYADQLILEKYQEDLNENLERPYCYFTLIDSLRFCFIQVIIACLQLLNRTQALLILIINLCFFVYFMKLIRKISLFESKFSTIKTIIQECCIMMALSTITLFSFTEKSDFASSTLYKLIEIITVLSIAGAGGAEFVLILAGLYKDMKESYCQPRRSNPVKNKIEAKSKIPKNESENDPFKEAKKKKKTKEKQIDKRGGGQGGKEAKLASTDFLDFEDVFNASNEIEPRENPKGDILSRNLRIGVPITSQVRYKKRGKKETKKGFEIRRNKTGFLASRR